MDLKLIVSGRGEGKTTALVAWLLRGRPIDNYPGWSRVIVCHDKHEVDRLKREVFAAVGKTRFSPSHVTLEDRGMDDLLHKTVWRYAEIPMNTLGADANFEYAIDNLDIAMYTDVLSRVSKPPAFATITATVFTPQEVIDHD